MSNDQTNDIRTLIAAAVARRDDARDAWAERLAEPLAELPGPDLAAGPHKLRRRKVWASCSQGQGWPEYGATMITWVIDDRWTFGVVNLGHFDGNNYQHQHGPALLGDTRLRPAPVRVLAEIARDLPGALQSLLADLDEEAKEAEAALRGR